jgi:hypothetical protein
MGEEADGRYVTIDSVCGAQVVSGVTALGGLEWPGIRGARVVDVLMWSVDVVVWGRK